MGEIKVENSRVLALLVVTGVTGTGDIVRVGSTGSTAADVQITTS
jgi:hypothetical protein